MRRTVAALAAVVFGAAAVALFTTAAIQAPAAGAEGAQAVGSIHLAFVLVLVASACGCLAIVATTVAVGTRR